MPNYDEIKGKNTLREKTPQRYFFNIRINRNLGLKGFSGLELSPELAELSFKFLNSGTAPISSLRAKPYRLPLK